MEIPVKVVGVSLAFLRIDPNGDMVTQCLFAAVLLAEDAARKLM